MALTYLLKNTTRDFDPLIGLKKINDYLLTFVGEIEVKKPKANVALIYYADSNTVAKLEADTATGQMSLICHQNDNLTINLIKNVTKHIGLRIFNTQTKAFLVSDPNLLETSSQELELNLAQAFKKYQLTPLYRFHNSLVFFARDKKGQIHLVNRHLLEHFKSRPEDLRFGNIREFSVIVAPNIGMFVALFDRGLIPINFHQYLNGRPMTINLSGLPISKKTTQRFICFQFDAANQTFTQTGQEIARLPKKYLVIKINPDVNYIQQKNRLIPQLNVSVFLA